MAAPIRLTRRRLLQLGLALPLPMVLAACDDDQPGPAAGPATTAAATAPGGTLAPTPACDDGDDPTLAQTEGPYFTPDSPSGRRWSRPAWAASAWSWRARY